MDDLSIFDNPYSQIASQDRSTICFDEHVPPESKDIVPELFTTDSLLELCNAFWKRSPKAKSDVQPYLRGCKWSPDGTCCLSVVNNDGFHIMELPRDLYEGCPSNKRMITMLQTTIHLKEGGLIYDFCWYPKMNSYLPETCSWISTKRNSPIQMWDAYDGSLRCSYRGFNAVDEMEPALCVTFTHYAERIVGGYRDCLRTFDVQRPGRDFVEHKINSSASCIATDDKLLAVGSWDRSIKLLSISDMATYKSIGNMHGHSGGVTHIKFTPDKRKIVSGARKDNKLLVWDLRYYSKPLNIIKRHVNTNQRIYFDISSCGRYLVSGGTDGVIRVWDENKIKWTEKYSMESINEESATFRFRLHEDCCNSVSIHPLRPILATGSGQYHFVDPLKTLQQEDDRSDDERPKSISIASLPNEEVKVESSDKMTTNVASIKDIRSSEELKTVDKSIDNMDIDQEVDTNGTKLVIISNSPTKESKTNTNGGHDEKNSYTDKTLTFGVVKLDIIDIPPSNIPNVDKVTSDDSESDLDMMCSFDEENKTKYSSYSENNLTFWWIGKVSEI